MKTKIKIGIGTGITLLLIACGSGTSVPKKKPTNYKTPTAKVTQTTSKPVVVVPTKANTTTKKVSTTKPRR